MGSGGHVEHVSACIEHNRCPKRVVMYSHDRCPKRVVMYTHAIEHVSSYIEHDPSFCALESFVQVKFLDGKRSCFLTYIVGDGAHVEHVSACTEHDRALKRVVMYSHDRCPKRVVMYLHVIVIACICVYRA